MQTYVEMGQASIGGSLDTFLFEKFMSGQHPHCSVDTLRSVDVAASIKFPKGSKIVSSYVDSYYLKYVLEGKNYTAFLNYLPSGNTITLQVVGDSIKAIADFIDEIKSYAVYTKPEVNKQYMGFWSHTPQGAQKTTKEIALRPWEDVQSNYPSTARTALEDLMRVRPDTLNGKLLLMYGPPGTGKTNALCSLASEWGDWCDVDCVLDPERMFNDSTYLMSLLMDKGYDPRNNRDLVPIGVDEDGDVAYGPKGGTRYRMVILEDCDELIRGEAKAAGGQALSRLLNVTDGLIGQSSNLLVGITTNEDISVFHPAVTRPGRCLAQIEVGKLSRAEAQAWLGKPLPSKFRDGATLAELYELKGNTTVRSEEAELAPVGGQYL